MLSTRGQYDEAERLYRLGLATTLRIRDLQGIAVFQMKLGNLALRRGRLQEALPLLEASHAGFSAVGLPNWLPEVEALLARARGEVLTLDDLLGLVWAARHGDHAAGQQAWEICSGMLGNPDWAAIGGALQQVLSGEPLPQALAALPAETQAAISAALLAE